MDVSLASVEEECPSNSIPLGTFTEGIVPRPPEEGEFIYSAEETLHDLKPASETLNVPDTPGICPPPGKYFPTAPDGGYTLLKTQAYTRGFAYVADYDLGSLETHKHRLIHIATPPLTLLNGRVVVPGMIRMEPGIPFVFRFNKEAHRMHTIGCLQTLESLKVYPDYPQILDASVQLAKLSWGYSSDDGSTTVPPVYELDGLKPNDRSTTRPFQDDNRDGSYSLGHTVMKGDGLGTVLPSVQANSSQAAAQISAILKTLHTLRRLVMPKCLSRFENDIWDFHMDFNNVFSFGGLDPNSSSVQLNVSSLGVNLNKAIGIIQGYWHVDFLDDPQFWTLFVLLLRIGPDGDPGPFFLARGGIYVHELGAWVVFLVFKGTDLHTGTTPHEDAQTHAAWVKSAIDSVWNLVGPQNRIGFVIYLGCVPSKHLGSANVTPHTGFGNYGSGAAHKAMQKDFASHGRVTMGSQDDRANRLGREAVSEFYNTLRHCQLSLNIDINKLMESISYQDNGANIPLRSLPYHPTRDSEHIKNYLALYTWHSIESDLFNLGITNKMLRSAESTDIFPPLALPYDAVEFIPESDCISLPIQEVLRKHVVAGRPMFMIRLCDNSQVYNIAQDHPCVLQNEVVHAWIMQQLDSNHSQIQGTVPNRITKASTRLLLMASETPASASDCSLESHATENVSEGPTPINSDTMQVDSLAPTIDTPGSVDATTSRPKRTVTLKRKYNSGNISDEDSDVDSIDDNDFPGDNGPPLANTRDSVYEVESIVGHRNFDDATQREWLVKFKGYDKPEYVKENDLSGCMRILSRYNRKNGLENLHLAQAVVAKVPRKDVVAPRVNAVSELAANYNQLLWLLDERRLDTEITGMIYRFQNAINGGKDHWSTDTTISSLATLWTDHCNTTYDLSDCLPFFESSPIDTMIIKFAIMQKAMSMLPRISTTLHQLDVVERGFQQELCHALVSIYEWYTTTGPLFSQLLLSFYETSGFESLKEKSMPLAQLIDHVIQYAYSRVKEMRLEKTQKPARRPRLGKNHEKLAAFNNLPQNRFHQKIAAESLSHVPGNLYGLLESPKLRERIKLPQVAPGRLPVSSDPMLALFNASAACLEELWSWEILLPGIKSLESHSAFKSSCSSSGDLHILRDRVITRGAILSCLQQACQSDGIFASAEMKTFLSRPTQDLLSQDRDSRRAEKLQGPDRDEYLQPLREAIEERLNDHPAIVEKVARLGDLTETHLFAVYTGGVVDYDNFLPVAEDDLTDDLDPTTVGRTKKTSLQFTNRNWTVAPAAKKALLSQVLPTPFLTPLALILREALNKKRKLRPANETISRILNGSHPNQSSNRIFPQSHTEPIRQFSEYALLFQKHLPGHRLTSRPGISSLLSWMGTGQGCGTKEFLSRIVRTDGFFSSTVDKQLEVFRPVISNNRNLSFQLGSYTDGIKMHLIPGYIACFDERIWGQPNNLFNICPVIRSKARASTFPPGQKPRLTIEEKFALYWCQSTQDKWVEFLGGMVDQDPATWDGQKPSWFAVMDFLQSLEIPLFGRGLTVLQTANNLVFSKIVTMPTQAEVAGWIFKHKSLGAHRGLHMLGFSYLSSHAGVKYAFTVLYDHLDQFLSDDDKEILGFNPLFLEHVLCKVARWSSRLQSSKANGDVPSLQALSVRLEEHFPTWISEDNKENHLAIPFPLTISNTRLIELQDLL